MFKKLVLWVTSLVAVGGCASVDVDAYRAEKPQLELKRYFDGTIDAWGVFQDRSGKVVKRSRSKPLKADPAVFITIRSSMPDSTAGPSAEAVTRVVAVEPPARWKADG